MCKKSQKRVNLQENIQNLFQMLYPIVAYGHPMLRKPAEEIMANYPNLAETTAAMFETMYNANGVGLAAPQVNLAIRLFVVDGEPMDVLEEATEPMNFRGD